MKNVFLLILIVLILWSCHKNDQNQNTADPCDRTWSITPIDSRMMGFFFKPGSYWVYRNDSLNLFDSLVLYNAVNRCEDLTTNGPPHSSYSARYYMMYYASYPSGYKYFDVIESSAMARNFFPLHYYWWDAWFLYVATNNDSSYIDTLQVGSHTFYKCYESLSKGTGNPPDIIVYTTKDIGIVKKIILGPPKQEWDLVRWKIEK